ncbi:hypothetical protein BEN74_01315 [Acinetobacter sp. WCHAc010034]|nr:hypothetical protein BEN74_01315 [Acinetobacter sp. WCHAc010034]
MNFRFQLDLQPANEGLRRLRINRRCKDTHASICCFLNAKAFIIHLIALAFEYHYKIKRRSFSVR